LKYGDRKKGLISKGNLGAFSATRKSLLIDKLSEHHFILGIATVYLGAKNKNKGRPSSKSDATK
jgi:hypothetical protein